MSSRFLYEQMRALQFGRQGMHMFMSRHARGVRKPAACIQKRGRHSTSLTARCAPVPQDTPRHRKSVPAMKCGSAPAAAASASAGTRAGEFWQSEQSCLKSNHHAPRGKEEGHTCRVIQLQPLIHPQLPLLLRT